VVTDAEAVLDRPLARLLLDADADELATTRSSQLAVLLTSLVVWEAVRSSLPQPVAFAGHSLGQITALIASGAVGAADGYRLAAARADASQDSADAHPGRMAALIGADVETAEEACREVDEAWLANDNAPGQVVIAGTPEGVAAGSARAQELGVRRVTALNVGGAFHTPLMADATAGLLPEAAALDLAAPAAPVVSNHDAVAYADGEGWRDRLPAHVSVPVRWRSTMDTLAGLGATTFLEVGHGSMLAALAKRGAPSVTVRNVATPEDIPTILEVA
jgi:[acyl-carrier-protein] S-malonyltransferase